MIERHKVNILIDFATIISFVTKCCNKIRFDFDEGCEYRSEIAKRANLNNRLHFHGL